MTNGAIAMCTMGQRGRGRTGGAMTTLGGDAIMGV